MQGDIAQWPERSTAETKKNSVIEGSPVQIRLSPLFFEFWNTFYNYDIRLCHILK